MRTPLSALVVAAALSLSLSLSTTVGAAASDRPAASAAADEPSLTLVHQDLAVAQDTNLTIQFHPSTPLGTDTISVLAYQPVVNRGILKLAIDRRLTGFIDRVDIDPLTMMSDENGNITVTVPTESTTVTAPALRLARPGLYPLLVRRVDASGRIVADLVTFADRLPAADEGAGPAISVAVLASVTAPPAVPGQPTPLPADVTTALTAIAAYPQSFPLSLAISPEVLGRLGDEQLAGLRAAVSGGVILSEPLVPLDPSAATAADLRDLFTQLLVDGENRVADTAELPPTSRSVWYSPDGITNAGALMLRDLGVRLLVISSDTYLQAAGNLGGFTDYSQLTESVIARQNSDQTCEDTGVSCMPTAVIDPVLAARLADTSLSDEQAALYTAADLVVYRDFFADSMSASNRHALVLGVDGDGTGVASAARVTRAMTMATATGAARLIPLDQFEQSSSAIIADGRPIELMLPQPTPVDLAPRNAVLTELDLNSAAVSSMLVEDAGRTDLWNRTRQVLYSSSITDDVVTSTVASLNADLTAIKACVEPPPAYHFTLTGRSSNLPLRITNLCNEPLTVVVSLTATAAKMEFTAIPPQLLEPNATSDITVPVTARTNGSFTISLDVLTPTGNTPVTDQVTLYARINTLTGLPQVITGAGLVILLTWWARNQRRSRRARRSAAAATEHHPAAKGLATRGDGPTASLSDS